MCQNHAGDAQGADITRQANHGHENEHGHSHDAIHEHKHQHDGVVHQHPHYHLATHEDKDTQDKDKKGHEHTHIYSFEVYAYADSPIHRLDARTKTLAFLALILAVVLTPASEVWRFGFFAILLALSYIVAGVPLTFGIKRALVVVPFVIFAGIFLIFMPDKPHPAAYNLGFARYAINHGGLYIFFNAFIKSTLSVLTAILLYSTTPFPKFIKGLETLRVPNILTMLFSFLYRFIWVLTDEVKRMIRARDARAFGGGKLWHLQIIGQMIGSLFIRSYERAERVYAAMVSRGYTGTIRTLDTPALSWQDGAFSLIYFAVLCTIVIWRF